LIIRRRSTTRRCAESKREPSLPAPASAFRGWPAPTAAARKCRRGRESLCERPAFTGSDIDGGDAFRGKISFYIS